MLNWIINNGLQAIIVCPKKEVTKKEKMIEDRYSAENTATWMETLYPGQVRMAHSGLDEKTNDAAIRDMKEGKAKILVSTTVVEVGLTIPKLHYAWIVHAERMGLVSLHQLAGRLARKGGRGYVHLWSPEPLSKKSATRLEVFVSENDGYELALRDMELRGVGDLRPEGLAQSGGSPDALGNHSIPFRLIEEIRSQLGLKDLNQTG